MTASVGHHHPSVAAAAEAMAHIRRSAARPDLDSTTDTAAYTVVSADPWVEVTEQPKSTAMRFRYQCEGRSAGTILGVNATIAQKTYPSIKVSYAFIGSWPSDHYFRSVCLFVCLCRVFLIRL